MDVINIDIIINVNAVGAICHLFYLGYDWRLRRTIPYVRVKDSLKQKSHLKTQQFNIVDNTAFDLPQYRRGGQFQA